MLIGGITYTSSGGPYAFHSYKAASACLTAEKPLWTGETHLFALAPGRARRYNDEKEH